MCIGVGVPRADEDVVDVLTGAHFTEPYASLNPRGKEKSKRWLQVLNDHIIGPNKSLVVSV